MTETEFLIARKTPRFSFIAEAEVLGPSNGTPVAARISKLSSQGCYIDTINQFPMDTELLLRIRYGCSTCELPCKVIYNHSGYGMGVNFGEITPGNRATLASWLDELSRKSG